MYRKKIQKYLYGCLIMKKKAEQTLRTQKKIPPEVVLVMLVPEAEEAAVVRLIAIAPSVLVAIRAREVTQEVQEGAVEALQRVKS